MVPSQLKIVSEFLIKKGFGPHILKRNFGTDILPFTRPYQKGNYTGFSYVNEPKLHFKIYDSPKVQLWDSFFYSSTTFNNLKKGVIINSEVDLESILGIFDSWLENIQMYELQKGIIDPWDNYLFTPPKELTIGIETIDFESQEPFTEEEQRLIVADLDKTQEFIRKEVGLDEDRLAVIESDIAEIKRELSKRSKFSWKEYAREKLIDELINAAKDRWSMVQLYKLFEFLGPFDLPQLGN